MKPRSNPEPPRTPPAVPPALQAGPRWLARPVLFALGVAVLFVAGAAALFVLVPEEPDAVHEEEIQRLMVAPETAETLPPYFYDVASRPAALSLTSAPAGAHTTLNAEALGPTPVSLDALRPGYYEVRLRHPGYAPLDTTLYFASGAHYDLAFDLTPFPDVAPETGRAQVGGAAPGGAPNPPSHRSTSAPPPDRFARADEETLRRVWHTGSLSVTSEPAGARVLIDGHARGQTPLTLNGLRPGTYTVTLSLRGYEAETRSVEVGAGAVHHLQARLRR